MLIRIPRLWQVPFIKGLARVVVELSAVSCGFGYLAAARRGAVIYRTRKGRTYASQQGPESPGDRPVFWAEALAEIRQARAEVERNNALIDAAAAVLRTLGMNGPIILAFPDKPRQDTQEAGSSFVN